MATQITLAKFEQALEDGLLEPLYTVQVGTEQRLYARTTEGQGKNPKEFAIVYAVVP